MVAGETASAEPDIANIAAADDAEALRAETAGAESATAWAAGL